MHIISVYSGELRTWYQCRDSHNELFKDHTVKSIFYTDHEPLNTECAYHPMPGDFYSASINHIYEKQSWGESQAYRTFCQWHNNFVAFSLAPKGYEVYCRNRPDIIFKGYTAFNVEPNTVYIPGGNDFRNGVNDQFAYGNYEVMKQYYSLYLNWHKLYAEGHYLHTEGMLKAWLDMCGINIVRLDWTNEIVR